MKHNKQNLQLKNPVFETIILLNEYNSSLIENSRMQMLLKNLRSNIKRAIYGSLYLSKLQSDEQLIEMYKEIIVVQSIEYMFYKISTTWDIAFQIANLILKSPKKNHYEELKNKFAKYCETNKKSQYKWYVEFNKLRNRIVHGGLNLITFYENKRIKFQLYDNNIAPQIEYNDFYNDGQKSIVFADYYFNYYSVLLYNYLCDFFKFVNEQYLLNKKTARENKLLIESSVLSIMQNQCGFLSIIDLQEFNIITEEMNVNKAENSKYDFYYR